jgi:hypothetical protein
MSASPRHRVVAWDKEDGYGVELVDVSLEVDRLATRGIGWEPLAYRLEFRWTGAPDGSHHGTSSAVSDCTDGVIIEPMGERIGRSLESRCTPFHGPAC